MDTISDPSPVQRRALSAPECYVLVYGWSPFNEPLKLAFAELVARDVLQIVEAQGKRGLLGKLHPVSVFTDGPNSEVSLQRPLRAAFDLYKKAPSHSPSAGISVVAIDSLGGVVRKKYRDHRGFLKSEVMPPLVEKGLFRAENKRTLFLFPSKRFVRTPEGDTAAAEIEGWLSMNQEAFGEMASSDPKRAFRFVQQAGPAILLMKDLHPQIRELRQSVGQPTGGFTDATIFPVGGSGDRFDMPDLDFGVFSAIDSAFDAIASGFDFGGGGDGGGGNGGGGNGGVG